ncbi:MAG: DegV family protein [Syntrophomonadaceae bacterium]|nr:DegV family protein [Syntrophomonadaceae bacterium]MDD4549273.1 DegV family protein [Syntrophomonadaceae bacterium]
MTVKIVTDSTSYIDNKIIQELDITIIPLQVSFPDESFKETEVDYNYFYSKIEETGIIPTSSQPSPENMYEVFENLVSKGIEVLAVFISASMSGTYETALSVKDRILRKYPGAKIEVLNSRTNCMAMGLSVVEAAQAAREGKSLTEVLDSAVQILKKVRFYFIPTTLEYLKKGGRIGGAAALVGSILNLRPILYVKNGETALLETVRGTGRAIKRMLNLLDSDCKAHGLKSVLIHHIHAPEKARELAQTVMEKYNVDAPLVSIGPVIGLHVGPGTIGIVYCTDD